MIICGLDTETTGLEKGDHRFVEVYAGLWTPSGKRVFELNQRIDPQRSISADAQRVHGISASDLVGKPTWETVGPVLHKVMMKADVIVWHNGDWFDGPFIDHEFRRIGLTMPKILTVDTMVEGVWADPDGKKPTLGELCFACNVPYDPALAHAADYDVARMMDCFFKGVEWGYYNYPEQIAAAIAA